jgi:hypothetical protein
MMNNFSATFVRPFGDVTFPEGANIVRTLYIITAEFEDNFAVSQFF